MLRNRFQQVVAVMGLGAALWIVGIYVTSLGSPSVFGWVAYSPLSSGVALPGRDLTSGEQFLVWLGLIAIWVMVSSLILKDRAPTTPE